uniref:Uncharacterized protein n=2 Tax=Lygus hesperus TaxID=30085 RepID=A0A146KUH5_LYGHE
MGKREEIYTVHVKCRPDPCQNYPSERAYSSSTVGGLALTHLTLAAVGTTLYTVSYFNSGRYVLIVGDMLGGVFLISGCVLAFIAGVLACKRWYVDRYIRWYFVACLLSTATAFLSAFIAIYGLSVADQVDPWNVFRQLNASSSDSYDFYYHRELHVHILLASVLETIVSLLSVKISWKGIRNTPGKTSLPVRTDGDGGYDVPSEICRPDILENHDKSNYSNVVRELYRLQKSSIFAQDELGNKIMAKFYSVDPTGLPQPESQKEYRERMEKFLASNDQSDKDSQTQ